MSLENTKEVLVLDCFMAKEKFTVKMISDYVGISEDRVLKIKTKYLKDTIIS